MASSQPLPNTTLQVTSEVWGVIALGGGVPGRAAPLKPQGPHAPNLGPQIFGDCWVFLRLAKWDGDRVGRDIQGREFHPVLGGSVSTREAEVSLVTVHPKPG